MRYVCLFFLAHNLSVLRNEMREIGFKEFVELCDMRPS